MGVTESNYLWISMNSNIHIIILEIQFEYFMVEQFDDKKHACLHTPTPDIFVIAYKHHGFASIRDRKQMLNVGCCPVTIGIQIESKDEKNVFRRPTWSTNGMCCASFTSTLKSATKMDCMSRWHQKSSNKPSVSKSDSDGLASFALQENTKS